MTMVEKAKSEEIPLNLIFIFLVLLLGIGVAGYSYYDTQKANIIKAKQEEFLAIADLKVKQIVSWREERLGDATLIHDSRLIADPLSQFLRHRETSGRAAEILAWMKSLQRHYGYKNILLADAKGALVLAAAPGEKRLGTHLEQKSWEALQSNKIIFTDLFRDPEIGHLSLYLVVPLLFHHGDGMMPAGTLILRVDPGQFLFPQLASWPTPSRSAETLLIRVEGDGVAYLSEPRHKGKPFPPSRPPVASSLQAALLTRGRDGVVSGNDYRGVPVIAALRKIPGSPWSLVAKVDVDEIYAPIRQRAQSVALSIGFLVVASGFGVCLWWLRRTRQMENQLRASEARYRSLFEDSPISLWAEDFSGIRQITDTLRMRGVSDYQSYFKSHPEEVAGCLNALKISDVNQATLKLFKAQTKAQLVDNLTVIFRKETFDTFRSALITLATGGTQFQVETVLQTVAGEKLHTLVKLSVPPGYEESWAKVIVSVNDITERKRAEDLLAGQYRILEMIATNAPLEEVLSTLVRFIESQTESMLGSILLLDEDGLHARHGAAPSLPEAFNTAVDGQAIGPKAGSCGTAMFRRERVVVTDIDLDPLWADYRDLAARHGLRACWSTPIISHEERMLGAFAMYYREARSPAPAERQLIDIATSMAGIAIEHRQADERLLKAHAELEQRVAERTRELNEANGKLQVANYRLQEVDRLKSMFIASMSHELRTPLNSIIGFSSILLHEWAGTLNDEQKENLAIVLRAGKHLLSLINDVIDVSKIEAGQLSTSVCESDVHEVVAAAVELLANDFSSKNLQLIVDATHQTMRTDSKRLLQCLLNLLSNALKYTEKGEVRLEVRRTGADLLEISVTDTGIGIREEDKEKIFKAFSRIKDSRAVTIPGTGLGLYLTRKLVIEVLQGEITFTSEYGKGSRFLMRLPLEKDGESGRDSAPAS